LETKAAKVVNDILVLIVALAAWMFLQRMILPRFGFST